MGHESQIEPWLPLNHRSACGFGTDRLRRQEAMKTAGRGTPNRRAHPPWQPSTWRGRSEQILLNQVGCEGRKLPAKGEIFFLTSTFIELDLMSGFPTYRPLGT